MGHLRNRWIAVALAATASAAIVAAQPPTSTTTAAQAPPPALRTFTPEEIAAMAESMPPGPARELTVRVCAQCHAPQRAAALPLPPAGGEGPLPKTTWLGAHAPAH